LAAFGITGGWRRRDLPNAAKVLASLSSAKGGGQARLFALGLPCTIWYRVQKYLAALAGNCRMFGSYVKAARASSFLCFFVPFCGYTYFFSWQISVA
jgi:hypothetical protein